MNWLNSLKIAILEKNVSRVEELMGNMPVFETLDEMRTAEGLLEESLLLVKSEKSILAKKMQELKKSKKFLESTTPKKNSLDLQS